MKANMGRIISVIMVSVGVLIGFFLAGSFIWAYLELPLYFDYDFTSVRTENQQYSILNCPFVLTPTETGQVSLDIPNTTDKPINILFRAYVSYMNGITRNVELKSTIPIGEFRTLKFEVNSKDIFYHYFIFVKTYQFSTYNTPSRMGSCAILMIPISFLTGYQVLIISILLMGLFVIVGIYTWIKYNRPMRGMASNALNAMITLSVLLSVALIAGMRGWWVFGLFLLVVVLLLVVVTLTYFISEPRENRF
ncbi:MAG: hypothetical protein A2X25_05325 [Chloroflexi bacterium GWB2_49_20]|nr:MAG: hypothetical protein A2X25_05325 [Chloroflexi bacterium GWB2_49_20]OGN77049.1 MAG: hypothetical protein A2X26_06330 [Chloroflexi bacterium GWC2_49_37]OGN83774.1 MAG: hypothetical protein A2X27_01925 [Chloroflexi bacterium GWD2_49_16]HCM96850.1 hypothetical protein [Anaerolineae bacterium]